MRKIMSIIKKYTNGLPTDKAPSERQTAQLFNMIGNDTVGRNLVDEDEIEDLEEVKGLGNRMSFLRKRAIENKNKYGTQKGTKLAALDSLLSIWSK
jgi:hypothetical protein